ncbi:plasma membrane-associated cation-binding protein 1 isoform X2 [Diospyros lotus]|uniref:plasma membrane-associated cation-binding protein 1 isoform X2 n=1 Tax=Diospyros lotus TaxID=55363 RepID=UPI002257A2E9|nr:plasma membrane-associated cation-binding protein 1 isoform X2 [Diospyros lotus]
MLVSPLYLPSILSTFCPQNPFTFSLALDRSIDRQVEEARETTNKLRTKFINIIMGYWKSKVLPKIKKVFENPKKAAAADFCKSFDGNKEEFTKVFEEKKTEFHAKVVEIYEASPAEIKALIKEPKEAGLKNNSTGVQTFLDELAKIEFPGSKPVTEASSKFGPALVQGPIFFVFEKVSTFIVTEEKPVEPPPEAAAPAAEEEGTSSKEKDKEIVVEVEEKKEEAVAAVVEEVEKTAQPPAEEPPKEEAPPPAEPPKP